MKTKKSVAQRYREKIRAHTNIKQKNTNIRQAPDFFCINKTHGDNACYPRPQLSHTLANYATGEWQTTNFRMLQSASVASPQPTLPGGILPPPLRGTPCPLLLPQRGRTEREYSYSVREALAKTSASKAFHFLP